MVGRGGEVVHPQGEEVPALVDQPADRAVLGPYADFEVILAVLLGSGADGGHCVGGVLAAPGLGPAPHGIRDGAINRRRGHGVEHPGAAVVERGHHQGALPADGGQQGLDHSVGAACHWPDRFQGAVDHQVHAGLQPQLPEVGHQPGSGDRVLGVHQLRVPQLNVPLEIGRDLGRGHGGLFLLFPAHAGGLFNRGGRGDLGQVPPAVGPEQGPGFQAGRSAAVPGRRGVITRGREQGRAARHPPGSGRDRGPPARPSSPPGCLLHLSFARGQMTQELPPVPAPQPALEPFDGDMMGVPRKVHHGRGQLFAAHVQRAHLPPGFSSGQLHHLAAAGVGQKVEVPGHGCGAGFQPLRAQQLYRVARGVVRVEAPAAVLVVGGDPGAGEPVLGIADEGVRGGHEGLQAEPVPGILLAQGRTEDGLAHPVHEPGRHRDGRVPLQAAVAHLGSGPYRVDAHPGQRGLQPADPLQIGEEAIALVRVE